MSTIMDKKTSIVYEFAVTLFTRMVVLNSARSRSKGKTAAGKP